ncbi:Hsp70 protein [Stackebrandtia endophytica]|uniref:Hsp70 protein n=1 Tax=Stackebrandtia endophytica TaxID=1496996 RepID=A0A543AZ72_9ACTN|nr:Hsp70 family protein [Stackebrandtia endophytica]TQL77885.1 Hsp70 protein [Stackebrandtia endophytica]
MSHPTRFALGIDFGTSHTTGAVSRADGRVDALMFDGSPLLPSAVFAQPDRGLLVGRDAVDSARLDLACFEPHPKRRIDDLSVLLGAHEYSVVELFTAVLGRVQVECERTLGGAPASVTITHPATWGPTRKLVLREAAQAAGLIDPSFVPEPVAAATYYLSELGHDVPTGSAVVVHDFGGGTFDASAVVRTETGFDVRSVDGIDNLGGVDIDEAILRHLRNGVGTDEQWQRLVAPSTPADRRHWRMLYDDVRTAKERLSRSTSADIFIPVLDQDVHLTRPELDTLARPFVERLSRVVGAVIDSCELPPQAIAGIFMVGGASRMPLAATILHQTTGRSPVVTDRLEQVVAHGAVLATAPLSPVEAPAPTVPSTAPTPAMPSAVAAPPVAVSPVAVSPVAVSPVAVSPQPTMAPPAPTTPMPSRLRMAAILLGTQVALLVALAFEGIEARPLLLIFLILAATTMAMLWTRGRHAWRTAVILQVVTAVLGVFMVVSARFGWS